MRIKVQWVPPLLGGSAAVYRPNDEVSSMQMETPRMALALASWVAPVDLPEHLQCEDSRRDGSQTDQAWMAVGQHCGQCRWGWRGVLRLRGVPSRSQQWLLNRTDLANGMVQKI